MVKVLAVLLLVVLLIVVTLSSAEVVGKGEDAKTSSAPKPVVTSSKVPDDVDIPPGFTDNPIAFFDDYSWKAFIAVVWPGLKDHQGEPDTNQTVDGAGPRVFETYKSLAEVFHPDGSAPADLDQYDPPKYNPCGVKTAYGDLTLGSFSKFSNLGQAGFGTLLGPLVAQNTTYVRYLTGFSNTEFKKIRDNKWYLRSNLPAPPASVTFDNGNLDVKSAWIDMTGIAHPERYYVRTAHVLDPVTGKSSDREVGLVGLHIVQKTPSRPQWIWSSFEHVDNVPPAQAGGRQFAFNDGKGTAMPATNPYALSRVLQPPTGAPFNVTRVKPIHASTAKTNDDYHSALGPKSVWRFYQLVVTQWPTTPNKPALDGLPKNTFPGLPSPNDATAAANVTMETFEQKSIVTGCMACHNATMKPTDFVWTLNDHAFPPSSSTPNLLMKNPSFRELRDILLESKQLNEKQAKDK